MRPTKRPSNTEKTEKADTPEKAPAKKRKQQEVVLTRKVTVELLGPGKESTKQAIQMKIQAQKASKVIHSVDCGQVTVEKSDPLYKILDDEGLRGDITAALRILKVPDPDSGGEKLELVLLPEPYRAVPIRLLTHTITSFILQIQRKKEVRVLKLAKKASMGVYSDVIKSKCISAKFEYEALLKIAQSTSKFRDAVIQVTSEFGESTDFTYYEMEFCEHGSLWHFFTRGTKFPDPVDSCGKKVAAGEGEFEWYLPPQALLDFATKCARGVAACHENDLAHRDIKLQNFCATGKSYDVKLIDAGAAKEFAKPEGRKRSKAKHTTHVGTIGFTAPEVMAGKVGSRTVMDLQGSDIFSLGLVFSQLLLTTGVATDADTGDGLSLEWTNVWQKQGQKKWDTHCAKVFRGELFDTYESLVRSMLKYDPKSRPDIQTVLVQLSKMDTKGAYNRETYTAAVDRLLCPSPQEEAVQSLVLVWARSFLRCLVSWTCRVGTPRIL